MDLQKAKILLEKINSLYKSMSVDAGNIANIEKDLMRDYIRQLYEVFLSDMPATPVSKPKVEIIKSTPKSNVRKKSTPPPRPVELEVTQEEEVEEEVVRIVRKKAAPKPPRVIDLPDSLKDLTEPTPAPTPKPAPKPKPKPAPKPQATAPKTAAGEEIEELFEQPPAKELSEKLSNLPIKDLRKAMGLNEKIFTINELFGGDQAAYDASIATLNSLDNFEQATAYLIDNVASKYGWAGRGKKKKAKNFIKLVRRRYS